MAPPNRFNNARKRPQRPARGPAVEKPAFEIPAAKPPTVYGKAFILLEDEQKQVFEYRSGAWVPYGSNIVQLKEAAEVKQLPQKINKMTRYEVRLPLSAGEG
jgi:hypothetical protein